MGFGAPPPPNHSSHVRQQQQQQQQQQRQAVYPSPSNNNEMTFGEAFPAQQQQQQGVQYHDNTSKSSGILPKSIMNQIDALIDRINASSGYSNKISSSNSNSNSNKPVRIICVGTNEGIPLSRSYGSSSSSSNSTTSIAINEELLNSLETTWNTLPSSTLPNDMTSSILQYQQQQQQQQQQTSTSSFSYPQPPHPLLQHIGMGPILKSTTIHYDHCIYIQVHYAPLVITIIISNSSSSPPSTNTSTTTLLNNSSSSHSIRSMNHHSHQFSSSSSSSNVGYIQSFAIPHLKEILSPVRKLVQEGRVEVSNLVANGGSDGMNVEGGMGMNYNNDMAGQQGGYDAYGNGGYR